MKAHGVSDVFEKVSKKLGVTKSVVRYFPENSREMLTAAQYMLSEGNGACIVILHKDSSQ